MESIGLLKRAGQGERRAAVYGWPYIWTGIKGCWTTVKVCVMGISWGNRSTRLQKHEWNNNDVVWKLGALGVVRRCTSSGGINYLA